MRRHRRAVSSSICVHSKVAPPSRPLKLPVISQTPGAPSTSRTRKFLGHLVAGSARNRSQASWKRGTDLRRSVRSLSDRRRQSPSKDALTSNFDPCRERSRGDRGGRRRRRRPPHVQLLRRHPPVAPCLATDRSRTRLGPHVWARQERVRLARHRAPRAGSAPPARPAAACAVDRREEPRSLAIAPTSGAFSRKAACQ